MVFFKVMTIMITVMNHRNNSKYKSNNYQNNNNGYQ